MKFNEYAPDWRDTIRPAILKRDQYRCKHCGVKHRAKGYYDNSGYFIECDEFMIEWAKRNNIKPFTMYLQVAHLDQNKQNNDDKNLLSLCPRCHGKYDKNIAPSGRSIRYATPRTV